MQKNSNKNHSDILYQIQKYKSQITDIKNTENKKIKQINILKIFELLSQNLNIKIQSFKFDQNILKINFNAKFKNCINFINVIEKMAAINSCIFEYEKSILYVDLILDIKKSKNIDIRNIGFEQNIANPFIFTKDKDKNAIISRAIIGEYLILNNKWYKVGDKYKKYIIKKIAINYIELQYKDKIIKMEIFDDKNY